MLNTRISEQITINNENQMETNQLNEAKFVSHYREMSIDTP